MNYYTATQASVGNGEYTRTVSIRVVFPFIGAASTGDVLTYSGILFLILFITYLVHVEIKKSKKIGITQDELIKNERDKLEIRIAERTRELIAAETGKLNELNRTAQFGRLSQGLFHDLMSPLTSLSLYVEKLSIGNKNSAQESLIVDKVVEISKRMNSYMESVRRCLGDTTQTPTKLVAEVTEELNIIRDVLGYKARMAGVELRIESIDKITLPIHPVRLHQLLLNLASNAIEACIEKSKKDPNANDLSVIIEASKNNDSVTISIADNGCGMTEDVASSLFTKPTTTKEHGLGIGLRTVKNIVEDELHGNIEVESRVGEGSKFRVKVPVVG